MLDVNEQITGVDRLSQAEANYVTVAKSAAVSCATCRWFDKATDYCGIVKATPVDIVSAGGCDRHESKAGVTAFLTVDENAAMVQVKTDDIQPEAVLSTATIVTTGAPLTLFERVKALFAGKPDDSAFVMEKGLDGKHYWFARYTNNFEDRDKEILSQKAHEAFVARVNLGFVEPPELWTYHAKGTSHGQADEIWMHAGFIFAFGHFDDTPEAKNAIKYYQKEKDNIELSHGFTYPKWAKTEDGVYTSYNTFEISTLPKGAASNPFTSFEEIETMALSPKQEANIEKVLGKDGLKRVQALHTNAEKMSDVLKAIEVNHKDFVEADSKTTDTPSESMKAGDGEVIKTLLADMIAMQSEVLEQVDGFKAEITAFKAADETVTKERNVTLEDLKAQVAALKAQLAARPKAASTAVETKIEQKDLPAEVVNANVVTDAFWQVPVKGA